MVRKTFDDIVLFARTGLNPRQNFKLGRGENKYITIKNIHNNTLAIDENTDVVDDDAIALIHKRSQIKKGDVLFCSIGRLGDMYIITDDPKGWDINESVFAFTLNTEIIRQKYFYYLFKNHTAIEYLIKNSSGSTFKSIKMRQLKQMTFDLPLLDEQDLMVKVLDGVSKIILLRQKQLTELDKLAESRFVEMFGNVSQKQQLKEFSTLITKGASPKWQGIDYCNEGVLFVTSENVRKGFLDLSKKKYLPHKINEILPRSVLHRNDILVNIVNASIGRAAIFDSDELANINQAVALVRVDPKKINTIFLLTFLNSEEARKTYDFMKVGGDKSNLSLKNISELMIPVVSIAQQEDFAAFVQKIDKSKLIVQKSLEKLEMLRDTLMQQYFG